jgi:hypothetical protein
MVSQLENLDFDKATPITKITFDPDKGLKFVAEPRFGRFKGTISEDNTRITGKFTYDEDNKEGPDLDIKKKGTDSEKPPK